MAPSSSGGTPDGEALNILSNFDLPAMTPVQALHHYLESTRLAFADRNRYIGDPAYVDVPEEQLLSQDFGKQRACLINPDHALTSPVAPGDPFAGSGGCTASAMSCPTPTRSSSSAAAASSYRAAGSCSTTS